MPDRALTASRQTEDFNVWRQCPDMQRPKRRLRSAGGGIVAEIPELVVDRQPDSGPVKQLKPDYKVPPLREFLEGTSRAGGK